VHLAVGDVEDAVRMCAEAIELGVFAQAIRPPTVASGTSRLRLAAMASHTVDDMHAAARGLARAARAVGLDPERIGCPETLVAPVASRDDDYDPFDAEFGDDFEVARITALDLRSASPPPRAVFDGELDSLAGARDDAAGEAQAPEPPFDIERDARAA
jgi:glycine C-acetyltransferase/8-amino-7-oxononanoate synthase